MIQSLIESVRYRLTRPQAIISFPSTHFPRFDDLSSGLIVNSPTSNWQLSQGNAPIALTLP